MAAAESSQGPLSECPPVQVEMVLRITVLSSNTHSIPWATSEELHFLLGCNQKFFYQHAGPNVFRGIRGDADAMADDW